MWLNRLMRPRALLLALHLPFVAFVAILGLTGFGSDEHGLEWHAIPLAVVAGAIQIRQSLAVASGSRPTHWKWSLAALGVLAVLSYLTLDPWRSPIIHWFVVASLLMLLPRPYGLIAATGDALLIAAWS